MAMLQHAESFVVLWFWIALHVTFWTYWVVSTLVAAAPAADGLMSVASKPAVDQTLRCSSATSEMHQALMRCIIIKQTKQGLTPGSVVRSHSRHLSACCPHCFVCLMTVVASESATSGSATGLVELA